MDTSASIKTSSLESIQLELATTQQNAEKAIESATNADLIEQVRVDYFGKKGAVTGLMKQLKDLSADDKKSAGAEINQVKSALMQAVAAKQAAFQLAAQNEKLKKEAIDVTLPGIGMQIGSTHPVTGALKRITQILSEAGFKVAGGPEIEDDYHNFTALNIPETHPARAMHDTFYVEKPKGSDNESEFLLRTHTSPVQIRALLNQSPPVQIISPGRVYRCDSDVTHTPMFHQIEGLMIDKDVHFGHLKGLLTHFLRAYFENDAIEVRFRTSYFPFTEPSAEVDMTCVHCNGEGCRICSHTGFVEVLGCGMVHPNVLREMGIDPDIYQGFAFGMGVERLCMLKHSINDLRLFFENDLKFLSQFRSII